MVIARVTCPDTGAIGRERSVEVFIKGASVVKAVIMATTATMVASALTGALVTRINSLANPTVRATPGDLNSVLMLYIAAESASDVAIIFDNNVSQIEFNSVVMQTEVAFYDPDYTALAERYSSIYEYATLLETQLNVPPPKDSTVRTILLGAGAGLLVHHMTSDHG